jgi:hypothetical protein
MKQMHQLFAVAVVLAAFVQQSAGTFSDIVVSRDGSSNLVISGSLDADGPVACVALTVGSTAPGGLVAMGEWRESDAAPVPVMVGTTGVAPPETTAVGGAFSIEFTGDSHYTQPFCNQWQGHLCKDTAYEVHCAATGEVTVGLYSIVTFQYSSTTLYQVSYHIQYLFF